MRAEGEKERGYVEVEKMEDDEGLSDVCSGVLVLIHLILEVQDKTTFYFQLSVYVLIAMNIVCLQ